MDTISQSEVVVGDGRKSPEKKKGILIISILVVLVVSLIVSISVHQSKTLASRSLGITESELLAMLSIDGVDILDSAPQTDEMVTDNIVYGISCEGKTGLLVLSTNRKKYVESFMVSFDDVIYSAAVTALVASELDSSYSIEDSAVPLIFDGSYTSNELTAIKQTLVEDMTVVALAPNEYLDYCLGRILLNQ